MAKHYKNIKTAYLSRFFRLGGDEGSRTPVHDFSCDTFYMFSQSVVFI